MSWRTPSWPPGALATPAPDSSRSPRWFAAGDVNGFLGLALDNTTNLVIMSSLLIGVFGFPADLVLGRMLPGTALGVLAGDLAYTFMAVRLMRRTGRSDVTAMPFGIDTPTLFAMVFGVLGPVKLATGDSLRAWKVGMATTIANRPDEGGALVRGRLGPAGGAAGRPPGLDRRGGNLADRLSADAEDPA
jgi:hypothetical protein